MADPSCSCGVRRPDGGVGLYFGVGQAGGYKCQIVVGRQTHEHAGAGIGQSRRCRARVLHGAPRRLQQQPMLRVQQPDLARRHTEEQRVEPRRVIEKTCATGHNLAGRTGFRVVESVGIPAIQGYLRYRVAAPAQQVPELVGIRGARKTRRIADDRETRSRSVGTVDGYHGLPSRRQDSVEGHSVTSASLGNDRHLRGTVS